MKIIINLLLVIVLLLIMLRILFRFNKSHRASEEKKDLANDSDIDDQSIKKDEKPTKKIREDTKVPIEHDHPKKLSNSDSNVSGLMSESEEKIDSRSYEKKKVEEQSNPEQTQLSTSIRPINSRNHSIKRSPDKRGGRPRSSKKNNTKEKISTYGRRTPKPELVCWKSGWNWIIGVEIPKEFCQNDTLIITQGGIQLERENDTDSRWIFKNLEDEIIIKWKENDTEYTDQIIFPETNYLLFKLTGIYQKEGRFIKAPSYGYYLVIVPDKYKRNRKISGPAPIRPEPTSLEGYLAHYFYIDKGDSSQIAFIDSDAKKEIHLKSNIFKFELIGNQVNEASQNIGHLFGGSPPKIRSLDGQAWDNIGAIIIGEEGRGRNRWKKEFFPDPYQKEQELPEEFKKRMGGWYFLRFYNTNDELVESLDFRFIKSLRDIKILDINPLPDDEGHKIKIVDFMHDLECIIQPDPNQEKLKISRYPNKTIVEIPPEKKYDLTRWLIPIDQKVALHLTILVERIWWAVENENEPPTEWLDKPIFLSREDFRATSDKALWLCFPEKSWIKNVSVWFIESEYRREYNIPANSNLGCIPLREFEISGQLRAGINHLNVEFIRNGDSYSFSPCRIKLQYYCNHCNFSTLQKTELIKHIKAKHLEEFFKELSYEEFREVLPDLPNHIYKCGYCDFYIKSNNQSSATSLIQDHIRKSCSKAPRDEGEPKIKFNSISKTADIRKYVIKNLPHIYKCPFCDEQFENASPEEKFHHLIANHAEKLFQLK